MSRQRNRIGKKPRKGRSLVLTRLFFRLCLRTAKEHRWTGWIYWEALSAESKAAIEELPKMRALMGEKCPHFQRILDAVRSIFHRLKHDLKVLTESASAERDAELEKVRRFLVESEKFAQEIMVYLPTRDGLDNFDRMEIRAIAKLPRISKKQVLRLLKQFQHPPVMGTPIAITLRTRESLEIRDYKTSLKGPIGTPVDLPLRANFFFIPSY